jgi:hypothetical protein
LRSPALEAHRNAHDERCAVEPRLGALDHAAIRSPCCRSSPTKLARPSAYPHLERVLLNVDPLDHELNDPCLLGGEQLAPDRGEVSEQS